MHLYSLTYSFNATKQLFITKHKLRAAEKIWIKLTIYSLLQAVKSSRKLDPIPTPLLHILSTRLTPDYTTIIDRSLTSTTSLARVTPIIKNQSLDISTLSSQLNNYLNPNNIFNNYQSAYMLYKSYILIYSDTFSTLGYIK